MKTKHIIKTVSLLLCAIMLFMFFSGCGKKDVSKALEIERNPIDREVLYDKDPTATKGFRVGFGRTEILPEDSVPLRGYGDTTSRMSEGYLDRTYVTCVAVTDKNNQSLLMLTIDLCTSDAGLTENLRNYAKKAYGIQPEYVHLTGTHTHSAADIRVASRAVSNYMVKLYTRCHEAIDIAMADRKTAEIYVDETKTENLNFDRHYWREDGTACGDNYGYFSSAPLVSHIKEADASMRVIKFTRKKSTGEKAKDIVVVNWQAHDHLTGGSQYTDVSADWSGMFGKSLEEEKDCYFAYYNGCAGNINPSSSFKNENRTNNYREYGKLLSEYVVAIYDKMEKYKAGEIKAETKEFTAKTNQDGTELRSAAAYLARLYEQVRSNDGIIEACRPYNIHGIFHVRAILNRSSASTITIPVSVFSIGDIGFTTAPVEMFDELGETIRKESPFKTTFTICYTDQHEGYMPSSRYYDYGAYEVYISPFAKGTGEECVSRLVDMLKEIHK